MKINSQELKSIINLKVNKELNFDNLGKLQSKNGKKIVSFLENEKNLPSLLSNKSIVAVFTTKKLRKKIKRKMIIIESTKPKYDFGRFHNYLFSETDFYNNKISWYSEILPTAIINSNNISSEKVAIGSNTIIETNSVIYSNVKIGENVSIAPNVIIGEQGEFFANKGNSILRFIFDGGVIIGNNVKIQSMVSIKKGLFGNSTKIASGSTIGSFVNVGHDAKLDKNCYLAPGTIISGSCILGENCFFGVNSLIKNGIKIGKNCIVGAGSVVTKNVSANSVVVGVPAKVIRKIKKL